MGLDTVELLMELEDQFHLAVPDADASRLETVGQTADYLVARLRERAGVVGAGCASARLFYRLRRELVHHYSIPPRDVRPASRLGDLAQARAERSRWPEVATASGLSPPKWRLTAPFSPRFPPPATTVRDIVERAFDPRFHHPDGSVDEEQVWRLVASAAAQHAGMVPAEVRRGDRWVKDLGLD